MKDRVLSAVEGLRGEMVEALSRICRIPAVSPYNGGTGEEEKAREIELLVSELGLGAVTWQRCPCSPRPPSLSDRAGCRERNRKRRQRSRREASLDRKSVV